MIGNISSESNIRLAKSADNNNWTQFADAGTAPNQYALNTTNKTITVYGLTSFSYFTLGDNSGPLPVELTAFTASANGRNMILNWQTATEINSSKFVVERSSNKSTWSAIGEVAASGNSNSVKKYQFTDKARLNSGVYYYRLKMVDNDAKADYSPVVEAEIIVPSEFGLAQNYPNPFNPTTRIEYQLPQDATIAIELYSILGSKIADLFSGHQDAGYHSVDVNASKLNLQSGVYIYRLQVIGGEKNGLNLIKKMILTK
jgi:hypothetical protein